MAVNGWVSAGRHAPKGGEETDGRRTTLRRDCGDLPLRRVVEDVLAMVNSRLGGLEGRMEHLAGSLESLDGYVRNKLTSKLNERFDEVNDATFKLSNMLQHHVRTIPESVRRSHLSLIRAPESAQRDRGQDTREPSQPPTERVQTKRTRDRAARGPTNHQPPREGPRHAKRDPVALPATNHQPPATNCPPATNYGSRVNTLM